MKLCEVSIRKFRAFDAKVTIPLSDLTVLTGPNNLGKSTVLYALDMLLGAARNLNRPRTMLRGAYNPEEDYPKRYSGKPGRRWPTILSVTIELSDTDVHAANQQFPEVRFVPKVELSLEYSVAGAHEGPIRPRYQLSGIEPASDETARWLASQIRFVYIPANRNVEASRRTLFGELVQSAALRVSGSRRRLQALERFYDDVSRELAEVELALAAELKAFMPQVQSVRFQMGAPNVADLVNVRDIEIDDGAATSLGQKGDGFKSLFVISMLQLIAKRQTPGNLIFGIEEPEAHLHPSAIYEVKHTLRQLSESYQTIVTTHSPILVQRDNLQSNIVIQQSEGGSFTSSARPARKLADIRESLGIQPQDNLTTAEVVIVVEGPTEETCLGPLMSKATPTLRGALDSGRIRILPAGGAANVPAVVRALARDAASCLVLLDNDEEGRNAHTRLHDSGLVDPKDLFVIPPRPGCVDSEFEDCFASDIYLAAMDAEFSLNGLDSGQFERARTLSGDAHTRMKKWSKVMETLFAERGRDWANASDEAKRVFANSVVIHVSEVSMTELPWVGGMTARAKRYLDEH